MDAIQARPTYTPRSIGAAWLLLVVLCEVAAQASDTIRYWTATIDGPAVVSQAIAQYGVFLCSAAPLVVIELLWPQRQEARYYGHALLRWAVFLACSAIWAMIGSAFLQEWGYEPLLQLAVRDFTDPHDPSWIVLVLLILGALVLYDGVYYWFHRAQHTVPLLWRFHATHHHIAHLNSLNSYHHPIEDLLRLPFLTLPLAILFTIHVPTLVGLTAFIASYGILIHAQTPLSLGPYRRYAADARYHRIHHSSDPIHRDRNFAAFFPFWDALYGTQYLPTEQEYPAVGLMQSSGAPSTVQD